MERRNILIKGTVQGVGFRPFVFGLASNLKLTGNVKNLAGSVHIEVEGEAHRLDDFLKRLVAEAPPLSRISDIAWESGSARGDREFRIDPSDLSAAGPILIAPDTATCEDCLAEMLDPLNRRFNYPFLNCTHCGPRLTIIQGAPYDRQRTTMSRFAMCPACRAEYEDPTNRRFHAQPTACAVCGPRLTALDGQGNPLSSDDPLADFVAALQRGQIGAMKGLGGYHLICDATNAAAVVELRRRKHRDEKPFAIMVADLQSAQAICETDRTEQSLLASARRPIVLLVKKQLATDMCDGHLARDFASLPEDHALEAGGTCGIALDQLAPDNPRLGIMLPYTPLHHLLLHAMDRIPLVMTSGNQSDEPICFDNADAIVSLRGIADIFLVHDRPIHVRCDDSVTRVIDGIESPVRRSRGDAPQPIPLPFDCPVPILAVGGQLKATFALSSGNQAVLSHHLGDLNHFNAFRAFERDIDLFESLFQLSPTFLAHDLHPDYASTRYAIDRSNKSGSRRIPVQHHHAHMASCMAENGLNEQVIGVTFDGTGLGTDGAIWGGEFLVGDYRSFQRAAHFRYVAMPGGERAVREPWRMAVAHLRDAQVHCRPFERRIPKGSLSLIEQMITRKVNAPPTSSAGRLFDAVAAIIGLRDTVSYEGQAAMQLEWCAGSLEADQVYPFELNLPPAGTDGAIAIDTRPMIASISLDAASEKDEGIISRRFHHTLATLIARVCAELRNRFGAGTVVLSGGTFMNALLSIQTRARLEGDGFRVYQHRLVPPNDGGLSLGQLAVAASLATM